MTLTGQTGSKRCTAAPHRLGLLVASLALTPLTACGTASDSGPRSQVIEDAEGNNQVRTTTCEDLLAAGWEPPPGDPQYEVDPDKGLMVVYFGEDPTPEFALLDTESPACLKLPVVGQAISSAQEYYDDARRQECEQAVADFNAGKPPRRGDVESTLEALRQHVEQWCPESYAKQLQD